MDWNHSNGEFLDFLGGYGFESEVNDFLGPKRGKHDQVGGFPRPHSTEQTYAAMPRGNHLLAPLGRSPAVWDGESRDVWVVH